MAILLLVYLHLSCVEGKNTVQRLLRDVGWCCKEVLLPSKALWMHEVCHNVASQ